MDLLGEGWLGGRRSGVGGEILLRDVATDTEGVEGFDV